MIATQRFYHWHNTKRRHLPVRRFGLTAYSRLTLYSRLLLCIICICCIQMSMNQECISQTCAVDPLTQSCTSDLGEACTCPTECPDVDFTNCYANWGQPQVLTVPIFIPLINTTCNIEIHFCCRLRSVLCNSFVTKPIAASCELAITCIRIPKACIAAYTTPGNPPQPQALRISI